MAAFVLGVLAIACATAVSTIDVAPPGLLVVPTSYSAASAGLQAATLTAGIALIVAGLGAATQAGTRRLGLLALVAAIGWLAPELEGWPDAAAVVRSLAAASAPLLPFALVALVGAPRAVVVAVGAAAATVALSLVTLRTPFLDVYCWRACGENALLVHAAPDLVRAVARAWIVAVAVLGTGVAIVAVRRLLSASAPARRARLAVLAPVGAAGAAQAAHAVALLDTPVESAELAGFVAIHVVEAVTLTGVAVGIAWTAVDLVRTRTSVRRLAAELGEAPAPGRLRDALASAMRDPGLDVLYWLPDSRRYVDAAGVPREPADGDGTLRIMRGDRPLAVVIHDPALGAELEREIGSAARLAVENEALRAEVLAQLTELRASRTRIVETGDAARRRLERNLHDGAQQRLLAVALELRLARTTAGPEAAGALDAATAEVDHAFDELRDLAHGIFPAVLTEAGLEPALTRLAVTAPVAVEVEAVPEERFAPAVETGAYVTLAEAIDDAAGRGATVVRIRCLAPNSDRLVVEAVDDGGERVAEMVHVADRVGALGGVLELRPTELRAEIPCAS